MSLFDLPTKDTPLGPKNSGVAAFDKMIVQPVSQPGGVRALTPGETVTFNWRSDSSKWTNYKECRLYCRWEVRVGPLTGAAAPGAALTRCCRLPPSIAWSRSDCHRRGFRWRPLLPSQPLWGACHLVAVPDACVRLRHRPPRLHA